MITLSDPFRNLDLSNVHSIDQLALENVNGKKILVNQPNHKTHDSTTNEAIISLIETTLSDYRQQIGNTLTSISSTDIISKNNYEQYLKDVSELMITLQPTSLKVRRLWNACNPYKENPFVKNFLNSIDTLSCRFSIENRLADLFRRDDGLMEHFFRLNKLQKEELVESIMKCPHHRLIMENDFQTFIIQQFKSFFKEDEGDKNSAQVQSILRKINCENLKTKENYESAQIDFAEEISKTLFSLQEQARFKNKSSVNINKFLDDCVKLFQTYKPQQLIYLYKTNPNMLRVISAFKKDAELFRGLIDLKYEGDLNNIPDTETALAIVQLSSKLNTKDLSAFNTLLGTDSIIPAEVIKKAKPLFLSCMALLDSGFSQEKMESFISRFTLLLIKAPKLADKFSEVSPGLIEAILKIEFFDNINKSKLYEFLKKEGLEDYLTLSGVLKDKSVAHLQKAISQYDIRSPKSKEAFHVWLESFATINCSFEQKDKGFPEKLKSLKNTQLKIIRKIIKKADNENEQSENASKQAFELAKHFPLLIETAFKIIEVSKYDRRPTELLIRMAESSPAITARLMDHLVTHPSSIKKFEELYTTLEDLNELHLLETLFPVFLEFIGGPTPRELTYFGSLEHYKLLKNLETKYRGKLTAILWGGFRQVDAKFLTKDDEFAKAFIEFLNFHTSPVSFYQDLKSNPEAMRKIIIMAPTFPRAVDYLRRALIDPNEENDDDKVKSPSIKEKFANRILNKMLALYDSKKQAALIPKLLNFLENDQAQQLNALWDISEDSRIDPSVRLEIVERIADQSSLRSREDISQCIKIFKDDPNSVKSKALLAILHNPSQTGLVSIFLKLNQEEYPNLFARIASTSSCDALSSAVLNLFQRGKLEFAKALENSFDSSLTDSDKIRRLYPLLQDENYIRAESIYSGELKPLDSILDIKSGKIQERLLSLFDFDPINENIKTGILPLIQKAGTDEERMELIGLLAFSAQQQADQFPSRLISGGASEKIFEIKNKILSDSVHPHVVLNQLLNKYSLDRSTKETRLSLILADFLILPNGAVNIGMISFAKTWLQSLSLGAQVRNQISFVLDVLETDPEITQRLKNCPLPSPGSPAEKIVRYTFDIPKDQSINMQNMRKLLLSGLLYPTRQPQIGSCFATSFVIQLDTYRYGIKQKLEDYLALIQDNGLKRTAWDEKQKVSVTMNFPAFAEDLLNEPLLKKDHLLSRMREFTISSIAGIKPNNWSKIDVYIHSIINTFTKPLTHFFGTEKEKEKEMNIFRIFANEIKKQYSIAYVACKKNPLPPHVLGAWNLIDNRSHKLIDSPEQFSDTLINILANVKTTLNTTYPDQKELIDRAFDSEHGLNGYVSSWTNKMKSEFYHLSLRKRPWIEYKPGGDSDTLRQNYFEQKAPANVFTFRPLNQRQNLGCIIDIIKNLPESLKQLAKQNPQFSLPFSYPGHALSLKPSNVLDRLQTESTEQILAAMDKDGREWIDTPLSTEAQETIRQILKAKAQEMTKDANKNVLLDPEIHNFRTIRELFSKIDYSLIRLFHSETERHAFEATLLQKIIVEPSLSKNLPFLEVGDTNWKIADRFGFLLTELCSAGEMDAVALSSKLLSGQAKVRERKFGLDMEWSVPKNWLMVTESNLKMTSGAPLT